MLLNENLYQHEGIPSIYILFKIPRKGPACEEITFQKVITSSESFLV